MREVVMAKIMIVDNTAFMRMMLREIITNNGYEVVAEAENGKEAVQFFRQHKTELVTMDITMPRNHHLLRNGTKRSGCRCDYVGGRGFYRQAVSEGKSCGDAGQSVEIVECI